MNTNKRPKKNNEYTIIINTIIVIMYYSQPPLNIKMTPITIMLGLYMYKRVVKLLKCNLIESPLFWTRPTLSLIVTIISNTR